MYMLEPYIIEEIKKREKRKQIEEQPQIPLPLLFPEMYPEEEKEKEDRVIIIDLFDSYCKVEYALS